MSQIPKKHIDFCKAVAKLAAENDLNDFSISFKPAFNDGWRDSISANWSSGRHRDGMNEIRISSNVQVFEKVGLYDK